jgi:hypothetical protein
VAEAIEYDQDPEAQTGSVEWVWESRQDMALLDRLSGSRHPAYRRTVARVPDLPQSIVDRLADDEDFLVRRALAETNTDRVPVSTLRDLLLRGAGPKRNEIVKNPRVPDDLIDELSRSPEADHRWTAFHSGRLTDEQKARLARDPDPKLAAAVNPPPPRRRRSCGHGWPISIPGSARRPRRIRQCRWSSCGSWRALPEFEGDAGSLQPGPQCPPMATAVVTWPAVGAVRRGRGRGPTPRTSSRSRRSRDRRRRPRSPPARRRRGHEPDVEPAAGAPLLVRAGARRSGPQQQPAGGR